MCMFCPSDSQHCEEKKQGYLIGIRTLIEGPHCLAKMTPNIRAWNVFLNVVVKIILAARKLVTVVSLWKSDC